MSATAGIGCSIKIGLDKLIAELGHTPNVIFLNISNLTCHFFFLSKLKIHVKLLFIQIHDKLEFTANPWIKAYSYIFTLNTQLIYNSTKLSKVLTFAAPRSINVGPRPIVYIDLSITDTRNGRIPTGLEKKNSIDVQIATAIQRRTENNGESVPVKCGRN